MAKRLNLIGLDPVDGGVVIRCERLSERFDVPLGTSGVAALIAALLSAARDSGAAYAARVEALAFADRAEGDAPPVLRVDTADGVIVLSLSWAQVAGLAQLAAAMLEHSPGTGRPV